MIEQLFHVYVAARPGQSRACVATSEAAAIAECRSYYEARGETVSALTAEPAAIRERRLKDTAEVKELLLPLLPLLTPDRIRRLARELEAGQG
jgi:hypothetical protein